MYVCKELLQLAQDFAQGFCPSYDTFRSWFSRECVFLNEYDVGIRKKGHVEENPQTLERLKEIFLTFQAFQLLYTVNCIETITLQAEFQTWHHAIGPFLNGHGHPGHRALGLVLYENHLSDLRNKIDEILKSLAMIRVLLVVHKGSDYPTEQMAQFSQARGFTLNKDPIDLSSTAHLEGSTFMLATYADESTLLEEAYRILNMNELFVNFIFEHDLWLSLRKSLEVPSGERDADARLAKTISSMTDTTRMMPFQREADIGSAMNASYHCANVALDFLRRKREESAMVYDAAKLAGTWFGDALYRRVEGAFTIPSASSNGSLKRDCFRATLQAMGNDRLVKLSPETGPFGLRLDRIVIDPMTSVWNLGSS